MSDRLEHWIESMLPKNSWTTMEALPIYKDKLEAHYGLANTDFVVLNPHKKSIDFIECKRMDDTQNKKFTPQKPASKYQSFMQKGVTVCLLAKMQDKAQWHTTISPHTSKIPSVANYTLRYLIVVSLLPENLFLLSPAADALNAQFDYLKEAIDTPKDIEVIILPTSKLPSVLGIASTGLPYEV